MEFPRVTVVLITANAVLRECFDSICAQNYPKTKLHLIVNRLEPQAYHANPLFNKYENCRRNRNQARQRALMTDADYFLLVDDDIVLPPDAISTFAFQAAEKQVTVNIPNSMKPIFPGASNRTERKHVLGGYYPILGTKKYVCGRWVADHTFFNFTLIRSGLIRTDCVGLGCAFISRHVLEKVEFEAGTDTHCKDASTGGDLILGDCGSFGNRVYELGIPMFMTSSVVCQHLLRSSSRPAATDERQAASSISRPHNCMISAQAANLKRSGHYGTVANTI